MQVRNGKQRPSNGKNNSIGGYDVPSRCATLSLRVLRRRGVRRMEWMTKGLALEELEAHSFAQLLPDRIEMRRVLLSRRQS